LVLVLAGGLAYEWQHAPTFLPRQKESPTANAFIVRGKTIDLDNFTIALHEVDTLKTNPEETPDPWNWNIEKFGEDGLRRFLEAAPFRLRAEFKEANDAILKEWPTYVWYQSVLTSEVPNEKWNELFEKKTGKLRVKSLTSRRTGEKVDLAEPFSKWPLARISVRRKGESEPIIDDWYPENAVLQLLSNRGQRYDLVVEAIFNGSRKIGEPEACVVELRLGRPAEGA
jgi:hypothetical protein